jgi:hypothetical protein
VAVTGSATCKTDLAIKLLERQEPKHNAMKAQGENEFRVIHY